MKIKFLAKPPGTDYEAGQVAEFDSNDWVALSYSEKYLREGMAEEVIEEGTKEVTKEAVELTGDGGKLHAPTCAILIDGKCDCDGWPPAPEIPASDPAPIAAGKIGGKKK